MRPERCPRCRFSAPCLAGVPYIANIGGSHRLATAVTSKRRRRRYAVAMASMIKSPIVMSVGHTLLAAALLSGAAVADSRVSAPQFTARTLDGQTVSSSSLSGSVVLLQFWTSWCPVCRHDQPAVDRIAAEFGSSGLVVLAVDDGESEAVVRKYLQANPRSCPVVVSDGHSLAARFGVHGYPHYVVIDRNGNIAASRSGGGGEAYLRYLLGSA